MVSTGKAMAFWVHPVADAQGKLGRALEASDIPTIIDVYRSLHGKAPSGPTWNALAFLLNAYGTASHYYLGPPGMNEAAREALAKGIYETARDKDYLASAVKRFKVTPVHKPRARALAAIQSLAGITSEVKDYFQRHVAEGLK